MLPIALIATSGRGPSQEEIFEYISSVASPELLISAGREFTVPLLFAAAVLVVGRLGQWPAAHLSLPVFGWGFKMTTVHLAWFDSHRLLSAHLVHALLEGLVALVAVVALVALAVGFRSARRADRFDLWPWLSALLVVVTVIVDWAFLFLVVTPWPTP